MKDAGYVQSNDYEGPDRRRCPAWQFVRSGMIKPHMLTLQGSSLTPSDDYPDLVRQGCALVRGHKGKHSFTRDYDPKQYDSPHRRKGEGTTIVA